MSIYRPKKSPYWHYDFTVAGRRFHGSTGATVKEDAKNIEADIRRRAVTEAHFPERIDMLLRDAFGRYWQEHGRHKKTAKDIFQKLETLIDGLGADLPLSRLGNRHIADYITLRRARVSDASVNREITLLRAVLNRAAQVWDIHFKMPNWKAHRLHESRGRVRSLSADEQGRLLASLRPDMRPLVEFCLLTGARISSARTLTWERVDFNARLLRLEVKSKFMGEFLTLPITPAAEAILQAVRGQHPIYVFTYLCRSPIPGKRDKGQRYPFARDGWRRTWAAALKKAGIKDFRFHDLRHTAATDMLKQTKNIAAVQKVLGHRDVTTTMRYAHVLQDDVAAALNRTITGNTENKEKEGNISSLRNKGIKETK